MTTSNTTHTAWMRRTSIISLTLALCLALIGGVSGCCVPSGSDSESESSGSSGSENEESSGSKMVRKTLDKYPLSAKMPKDAELGGPGKTTTQIKLGMATFVTVAKSPGGQGQKLENVKKGKKKMHDNIQTLETEEYDNGWMVKTIYKGKSTGGTYYDFHMQRAFDGTPYRCTAKTNDEEDFKKMLSICKSLEKAS